MNASMSASGAPEARIASTVALILSCAGALNRTLCASAFSTSPRSLAIRPTFGRFLSAMAARYSSPDFFHQEMATS